MRGKPKRQIPLVSIVIPTHNRESELARLVKSILECDYPQDKLEIIVVDDASTDDTSETVKSSYRQVKVIETKSELFAAKSRNLGAKLATGEYLFFIDDDCVVYPRAISCLTEVALSMGNKAGIVAPLLTCANDPSVVWCAGASFRPDDIYDVAHSYHGHSLEKFQEKPLLLDMAYAPSAYLMKKSVFLKVGGFNHRDFPMGWEEIDLALRVKNNGYRNVCATQALVVHGKELDGKARSPARAYHHGRSRSIFYRKYLRRKILLLPVYLIGFSLRNKNAILLSKYFQGIVEGCAQRLNHECDS